MRKIQSAASWAVTIAFFATIFTGSVLGQTRPLYGFVDMHAHPMTNLAFGGKLIHGAPDVQAYISTDSRCRSRIRAANVGHALEPDNATHGGWNPANNACGDTKRNLVILGLQAATDSLVTFDANHPARGFPDFAQWPRWNDITHQKMFIDWIRRAHWGGLRVMVALATHNETLASAVMGPGDGPGDDRSSGDLQIAEIKSLVARHRDFMEIARSSADLHRIVSAGKLAVVLGVELDNIGNFHRFPRGAVTPAMVRGELRRLYDMDVRYIFPVHVVNNVFSGTAVYQDMFNVSNIHLTGRPWQLECVDTLGYRWFAKAGEDVFKEVVDRLNISPSLLRPVYVACKEGQGHANAWGLSALGVQALGEMMKLGMLIDIDHMSQRAADCALQLADEVPGDYPLNSGHSGPRATANSEERAENSRTDDQLTRIANLGGMVGVGSAGALTRKFIADFRYVSEKTGGRGVAMGTDLNGLVHGVRPPLRNSAILRYDASFPPSRLGTRTWDFNVDGVAHYGLLADLVQYLRTLGTAHEANRVVDTLFRSADDFYKMWSKAERQSARIPAGLGQQLVARCTAKYGT